MELPKNRIFSFQINLSTLVLIAIIVIGGKIGYNLYMEKEKDLRISIQNESALKDSIRVTKNKLDDAVYSKEIFVAETNKKLLDLNQELGETIKHFDGKIHELSILTGEIKNTTDQMASSTGEVTELPDGTQSYDWELNTVYDAENSRLLKGVNRFKLNPVTNKYEGLPTIITHDEIKFQLTQGLRTTNDGRIEMFASSTYPGFSANSFESAIIDPKTHPALKQFTREKRWGLGLYGGYGITANLKTSEVIMGPQIGIGITYKLW